MIIDSHLHIWDRDRATYDWLGPHLPEIDRNIHLQEVEPLLGQLGVGGVILVQSADNAEDTHAMLEVAQRTKLIVGIVGWVPVEDPEQAEAQLALLGRELVGVRNLVHDRADDDWVLRTSFREGLEVLSAYDLPFDFVTSSPAALPRLRRLAEDLPQTTFVLDHLGKPPIGGSTTEMAEWEELLSEVARSENVVAKISGLCAAGPDPSAWTPQQIAGVIASARAAFGAERLLYGGDWPLSIRSGGYGSMFQAVASAVGCWGSTEESSFWSGTAVRVYGLDQAVASIPSAPAERAASE